MLKRARHSEILFTSQNSWWTLPGTLVLAFLFLLLVTARPQRLSAVSGLALFGLLCFALGCGGGGTVIGGGGGGGTGATPTSITFTTSNAKVDQNTVFTMTAQITAQHPLTGMVTLFDYGTQIATFGIEGSQSIMGEPGSFYGLGVHQFTAHYTGDPDNAPSASSALTQTITGTTGVSIVGNTGGDFHSLQATLTLQ